MVPNFLQYFGTGLTASVELSLGKLRTRVRNELQRARFNGLGYLRQAIPTLPHANSKGLSRIQPAMGLVLAFGGIAAVSGYLVINDYAIAPIQHQVDRAVSEVSSVITDSIDRHITVAESAAALFSGPSASTNRWDFLEFARALPDENPGLSAIEWLPRVMKDQRSQFERSAKKDGLFDFRFVERAEDGHRVKAADRPEYFPVYYLEPYAGNEAMLGLDIAVNKKVAAFLAHVRDSGTTEAAPADLMSSGSTDDPDFSIVVPVYRLSIVPITVVKRREALSGFVRADFRFDRLLDSLRSRIEGLPDLEVYIFDRDDENKLSLIYFFHSSLGGHAAREISAKDAYQGTPTVIDHEVAGRRWNIVIRPIPSVFQTVLGHTAWGFVVFTLLLTALLLRHLTMMRLGKERAEAANRAKSEFLAMMSHELRTPLNAVIGFSDMMINELFGPQNNEHYKQYTAHINHSAMHLLELINTILDLSKIEAGYYRVEKENFVLSEVWHSVYEILQVSIADSGVEIEDDLCNSPLVLHADSRVFRQILLNLVSNAIKFTHQGGRVAVTAGVGPDGRLLLRIIDTGIGIAKEHLDLVLEPFRQVDNSLSRNYEGIGLGLPLTRRLVELQGGELRIDSQMDEGTTVTVKFPGDIVVADDASKGELTRQDSASAAGVAAPGEKKVAASRR